MISIWFAVRRRWWLLGLLPLLACAFPTLAPTPTPAVLPDAVETRVVPAFAGIPQTAPDTAPAPPFAPYTLAPINRAHAPIDYPFTFDTLLDPGLLTRLNPSQQLLLSRNGFVVLPVPWPQLYQVYQRARETGDPIFISTDAVLALTDTLLTAAWQRAEQGTLTDDLYALSQGMQEAAARQQQDAVSPVREAARQNLAFFTIAGRLLDVDFPVPEAVAEIVADELILLDRGGIFVSPLLGEPHDYSRYRPFGHYAADLRLSGTFRATTWYQQVAFDLDQPDLERLRQQARQLLLLGRGLQTSQNWTRWQRVVAAQAYFMGAQPADLTLPQLAAAAQAVYGGWPLPVELADTARLDNFIATVRAQSSPGAVVRWLPRPRPLADALLPDLLFNRVGGYEGPQDVAPFTGVVTPIGVVRGRPHGLDLAALSGSAAAWTVLESGGDTQYQGFAAQFAALQARIDAWDAATWTETLDGAWLYSLLPLLSPPAADAPSFMRAPAWMDKQLMSWMGGWVLAQADLAWQPSSPLTPTLPLVAGNVEWGYVEPVPAFYAHLAALTQQVRDGLAQRDLLDAEMGKKLAQLAELLHKCQQITAKELAGVENLSPEEQSLMQTFGDDWQRLVTFTDGLAASLPPTLVDAYTDPNTGQALQVGVGEAWQIYVIVPIDGQPVLAVGGVFSGYQFGGAADQRLPRADWPTLTPRPQPAPWMRSYLAP
ncbi:MAG: DUF3160 domain-containing protein [Ardenticatenales bacterium]|nr:DUF3160 domain-containing protein [Ardenticatenales bacterium]